MLDDLVDSLCKFTTLFNPTASDEEPVVAFGDDTKARMAAVTIFSIANKFGDFIRTGWRNIMDCILRLHKLGLLLINIIDFGFGVSPSSPPPPPAPNRQE